MILPLQVQRNSQTDNSHWCSCTCTYLTDDVKLCTASRIDWSHNQCIYVVMWPILHVYGYQNINKCGILYIAKYTKIVVFVRSRLHCKDLCHGAAIFALPRISEARWKHVDWHWISKVRNQCCDIRTVRRLDGDGCSMIKVFSWDDIHVKPTVGHMICKHWLRNDQSVYSTCTCSRNTLSDYRAVVYTNICSS